MHIDPKAYRLSMEDRPSRSTPVCVDLGEWRLAQRGATVLEKSYKGRLWFRSIGVGLDSQGRPVVLVVVRWTPQDPLLSLPARIDGVPLVLRRPFGPDLDLRDVVKAKRAARRAELAAEAQAKAPASKESPPAGLSEGRLLPFRKPSTAPRGDP